MDTPIEVKRAISAIYLCMGLSVGGILIDKLNGNMTGNQFMTGLIMMGLFVIVPYKIGRKSNPTRYVYAVLTAIGLIGVIGMGGINEAPFQKIADFIEIPITLVSLAWLFSRKSNEWFNQ